MNVSSFIMHFTCITNWENVLETFISKILSLLNCEYMFYNCKLQKQKKKHRSNIFPVKSYFYLKNTICHKIHNPDQILLKLKYHVDECQFLHNAFTCITNCENVLETFISKILSS